jgi:hypothetical protein
VVKSVNPTRRSTRRTRKPTSKRTRSRSSGKNTRGTAKKRERPTELRIAPAPKLAAADASRGRRATTRSVAGGRVSSSPCKTTATWCCTLPTRSRRGTRSSKHCTHACDGHSRFAFLYYRLVSVDVRSWVPRGTPCFYIIFSSLFGEVRGVSKELLTSLSAHRPRHVTRPTNRFVQVGASNQLLRVLISAIHIEKSAARACD